MAENALHAPFISNSEREDKRMIYDGWTDAGKKEGMMKNGWR
jgi:hypothetical protein